MIIGTGHGWCLNIHLFKEVGAHQALTRQFDLVSVIPASLNLSRILTYDFITRLHVAGNVDLAHIDPTARIDKECKTDQTLLAIDIGRGVDVRKRVALFTQTFSNCLDRLVDFCAGEVLPRCNLDQFADFFFRNDKFTDRFNAADQVTITFALRNRQVNIFLIRADRHLR